MPIDAQWPALQQVLQTTSSVVLQAPPGAGKTSRVPPAILESGLAGDGRIIVVEPRRLAARSAARRIAYERGWEIGKEVGWHVRFDKRASRDTRLLCVTPGILLRLLHDDPFLESTNCLIFDEFHERGLETDLALGMVRLVQKQVRPELKIVVMSATLATEEVSRYLDDCPTVVSEGRTYPVELRYQPRSDETPWPLAAARAIQRLLDDTPGDILAFLPGVEEIRATADYLEATVAERDLLLFPLHGELPPEEQDRALQAYPKRKIVLATNVAETSVTVEGITAVVDTGLARQKLYDVTVGLDRLQLTNISRASAEQRAGRAGRTQPGLCVRLWSESSHRGRPDQTDPEIRRIDLASAVMDLLALGENPATFPWLDPPNAIMLQQALQLLERLGALRDGKLTEIGQQMAKLPVHPRLGRLMLEGARLGNPRRAALAAALLSERDPFVRGPAEHDTPSDILDRIESLEAIERGGRGTKELANRQGARFLFAARDQLLRSLEASSAARRCSDDEVVLRSLLAAFPDRLCRRREAASPRGVMVGGRGVKLAPSSGVMKADLFLAIDVDAGQAETLVRQASLVERDWLDVAQMREQVDVEFDESTEKVSASRRTYFADLIIEERPSQESGNDVLLQAAQKYRDRVLPKPDSPAGKYLLRLHSLREWMPHLELPNFEGDDLDELLTWLVPGCRSFEEIRRADWLKAIQSKLTHRQRQLVEEEAPERLEVPSGSHIALAYEEGRPPVLAVRIQEMFGLPETPRIAGGRIKVLLHLLAPNYRPQQVTDDLASFWTNTYPIVRKELRARYPKHSWPEDPRVAEPRRGTRRPNT